MKIVLLMLADCALRLVLSAVIVAFLIYPATLVLRGLQ